MADNDNTILEAAPVARSSSPVPCICQVISGAVSSSLDIEIPIQSETNNLMATSEIQPQYRVCSKVSSFPILNDQWTPSSSESLFFPSNLNTESLFFPSNLIPGLASPPRRVQPLNQSLITSQSDISWSQKDNLKRIERKIELYPDRYDRDEYLQNAGFVILADWPSAKRLSFCSISTRLNKSGCCRLHQICPYCSWRARRSTQTAYVPNYAKGNWFWITGSFAGSLSFDYDNTDWLHYLDSYKYAIKHLISIGLIKGAYWTEEIALIELLPCRVLPHVHCLFDCEEFSIDTIRIMKLKVNEYLTTRIPDSLIPNVKVSGIDNKKHLYNKIGYMLKPLRLVTQYEKAWNLSGDNRAKFQLNTQMTDFINGHSEVMRMRPKMKSLGTLNPKSKNFIGTHRKDKDNHDIIQLINEMKAQSYEFEPEQE